MGESLGVGVGMGGVQSWEELAALLAQRWEPDQHLKRLRWCGFGLNVGLLALLVVFA
jgi:hypothetical protein